MLGCIPISPPFTLCRIIVMSTPVIYGIKNCDTMKKAFKWFESQDIQYDFHDYKKLGVDEDVLVMAIKQCGWDNVINRRGTTWRKLPESDTTNYGCG